MCLICMKMNIKVGILFICERFCYDIEGKSNLKMGYLYVMDIKFEYCFFLVLLYCGVMYF